MTRRSEFTRVTRRECLRRSGNHCEATGPRYGLLDGQRCNGDLSKGVEFDHGLAAEFGGGNSLENCVAVCRQCHKRKTANDIRQIRKADRQRDKVSGAYLSSRNPIPGSKGTRWKKKMNGQTVERRP